MKIEMNEINDYIEALKDCQERIEVLTKLQPYSGKFQAWNKETTSLVKEIFGEDSDEFKDFSYIGYTPFLPILSSPSDDSSKEAYLNGLSNAYHTLESYIKKLNRKAKSPPLQVENIIIPNEVINKLPDKIQKIVNEIIGCYEHGYYDACSVMCRKVVDNSIYIKFNMDGKENILKDQNGRFYGLPKKIELAKQESYISSQHAGLLSKIKLFGDVGAHSYKINLLENDLKDNVFPIVRLVLEEIFNK